MKLLKQKDGCIESGYWLGAISNLADAECSSHLPFGSVADYAAAINK